MKTVQILAASAALALSALSASANHAVAETSVRGRSGMTLVFKSQTQPAQTTIALSRQGHGVGSDVRNISEPGKVRWHNPSRQVTNGSLNASR